MGDTYVMIFIKTIDPYFKEINNILAYPNGFTFRVRYRQEWVKLQNERLIKGNNGLILIHSADPLITVPVRKVTISEVVKIGTLTFVTVKLGDIVEFSLDPEERSNQLDQFQSDLAKVTTHIGGVVPIIEPVTLPVGIVNKEFTGNENERILNRWGNLVEILGQFRCYREYDFIKFISLTHETGKPIVPQENPSGLEFPLIPGKGYTLALLQNVPRSGIVNKRDKEGRIDYQQREHRWLEIRTSSPDINFFSSRIPIVGRYEIYTVRFNTKEIMNEKISAIGISIHKKNDTAEDVDCEILLPVRLHHKISWHLWRILNVVVFILSGCVLLIPEFFQFLFPSLHFTTPTGAITTIQKVAIVLLVLSSWSLPIAEKWLNKIMGV